jgi:hypothetical protein
VEGLCRSLPARGPSRREYSGFEYGELPVKYAVFVITLWHRTFQMPVDCLPTPMAMPWQRSTRRRSKACPLQCGMVPPVSTSMTSHPPPSEPGRRHPAARVRVPNLSVADDAGPVTVPHTARALPQKSTQSWPERVRGVRSLVDPSRAVLRILGPGLTASTRSSQFRMNARDEPGSGGDALQQEPQGVALLG